MSSITIFLTHIKELFAGLASYFNVKAIPSALVPIGGFLFGFENILSLQALLILVIIDFVTGVVSAKTSGEHITSRKIVKTAFKIAVYGLLASAAHLTETITPGTTFMVEAMLTFLALTEMISILENAGKMGFAIPKRLLNQLHKLRDEEIVVTEKATTHTIHDKENNIVETHKVVEKTEEKHSTEKPNAPLG